MEPIVVSAPSCFKQEAGLINQLFEAGLTVLHLRKPGLDRVAYKKLIGAVDPVHHPKLAIHQFHELREDYEIGRLHFPEQHRRAGVLECSSFLNTSFVWSTSIHELSELAGLPGFSYTFFGPVFNSLSKPGYRSVIESGFRWKVRDQHPKLIALGGVDHINLPQVRRMGFDGVAVLGALWNEPLKALDSFKKLKQQWEGLM